MGRRAGTLATFNDPVRFDLSTHLFGDVTYHVTSKFDIQVEDARRKEPAGVLQHDHRTHGPCALR